MGERYRVLVIAEAANPEWVSVPLIGWAMSAALRDLADVHIVTQIRNAPAFTRAGLVADRDFTALDTERVAVPAYRIADMFRGGKGKGWTTLAAVSSLTYPYFEYQVWKRFGEAIRRGDFDLVHRVTPLSPTSYSPIAAKCRRAGVPFVLGPLNGGLPWPKSFATERHKEKEWLSYVRGAFKHIPGRRRSLAAASVIIAGSRHTAAEIPRSMSDKIIHMPENGVEPALFEGGARDPEGPTLRLCFIGRLVPYKGGDMAIEAAAALLRSGRGRLDVLGDGPMLDELKHLAVRLGVAEAVTFHGWVSHADVKDVAGRASVFLFPSVREFGGGAVLEAMALGLTPVVVDYGGPGELVADGRGIAVPLTTRGEIVDALEQVLTRLADRPADVRAMGENARTWALTRLTWPAKARMMIRIYDWAMGKGPKPADLV